VGGISTCHCLTEMSAFVISEVQAGGKVVSLIMYGWCAVGASPLIGSLFIFSTLTPRHDPGDVPWAHLHTPLARVTFLFVRW
jgi:hypothetical protein